MKFGFSILILLACLLTAGCWNHSDTPAARYLRFLNHYQTDSLQQLLAPDFRLKPTYTTYVYNREDFFRIYLRNYKVYKQKSEIIRQISRVEPEAFLVEDYSDYLRLLEVDPPQFKITVRSVDNKVHEVIVDTTETTREYFREIKEKSEQFRAWLNMKYPSEHLQQLHETEGLFLLRLNEYRKTRVKP